MQEAVGANLSPANPNVPALPRSQGDNSNGGRWVEGTRRALPAVPAQTLVLLRWCQNIHHQPRLCHCQRCRWLEGGGGGAGEGQGAAGKRGEGGRGGRVKRGEGGRGGRGGGGGGAEVPRPGSGCLHT